MLEKYIEDDSLRKVLSETLQSKTDAEEVLSIAKYNICTNQKIYIDSNTSQKIILKALGLKWNKS